MDFKGKRILLINIANVEMEDLVALTKEAKLLIAKEQLNSVLTLTNVNGISVQFGTIKVLKEFAAFNRPYVKAGAVIGLNSLQKIELNLIMKFSGRNLPSFNSFKEAAEWLVTQNA